jgi:hypothetical protein
MSGQEGQPCLAPPSTVHASAFPAPHATSAPVCSATDMIWEIL